MKYISIITLLFISLNLMSSDEIELTNLENNYRGSLVSKDYLITYGVNGIYQLSTDKGSTWKNNVLVSGTHIRVMKLVNDTIWALMNEGFIGYNTNILKENNWVVKKITEDEYIFDFIVETDFIFIRAENSTFKINKYFKKIASASDTSLKISKWYNFFDSQSSVYQEIETLFSTSKYIVIPETTEFKINDSLVKMPSNSKNNILHIFDKNLEFIKKLDISSYIESFNNIPRIYKHYIYKDSMTLFIVNNAIYAPNNELTSWKALIKNDSVYFNVRSTLVSDNNLIYCNKRYTNRPCWYDTNLSKCDSSKTPISSNFYGTTRFPYSSFQVVEPNYMFSFQGNNGLIMSSNRGDSWQIMNYYGGFPKYIYDDQNYYFEESMSRVFFTNNGGKSFKPRLFGDSLTRMQFANTDFSLSDLGYLEKDGLGFNILNTFYTSKTKNMIITSDGGKTVKFIENPNIIYKPTSGSNVARFNDSFVFAENTHAIYQGKSYDFMYLFTMSTDFQYTKRQKVDSNKTAKFVFGENARDYYLITHSYLDKSSSSQFYEISQTLDSGKTFKVVNTLDAKIDQIRFYEHNKDSLFIVVSGTRPNAIVYLYESNINKLQKIYTENKAIANLQVMFLSGKFYLIGENTFLENSVTSDLTKWKQMNWIAPNPSFRNIIFKDNTALGFYSDSLRPESIYRIRIRKDLVNSIESETDSEPKSLTSITQSTHIELYDILGRSIATFPSYEKLKAEIEIYPPPHLIKWRDEKGISHFEKMK